MAQNRGRRGARHAQRCLRACGRFWPGTQTIVAANPKIPWDHIKLEQFNLLPGILHPLLKRVGAGWGTFRIIPVESGRGCPYGCEFCTVTGFFGDSIRFRTNESVVNELLLLKARARQEADRLRYFSSTTILRSTLSARNHYCAISSPLTRRCTG